jgi:hypothetical protein
MKTDRNGNLIGDGSFHTDFKVLEFSNPGISSTVSKSETTESVYVTYKYENKSITCRFSIHENNAVKFGDQLNGYVAKPIEIMFHLGLAERIFVPLTSLYIGFQSVKMNTVCNYEVADITFKELYELGQGADISQYTGKVLKGTNRVIFSTKIELVERKSRNAFGQEVTIGNYIYN